MRFISVLLLLYSSLAFANSINCDTPPANNCCMSDGTEWCLTYSDPEPGNGDTDTPDFGLVFPANGELGWQQTARFKFTDPLPAYPATYIWKVKPRQQAGYYTTFFWGDDSGDTFNAGNIYYGFHPYPDGSGHKWEISVNGADHLGERVQYGHWYTQVARVWENGPFRHLEFYYNWPDTNKVLRTKEWIAEQPRAARQSVLTFGDAPWNQNSEACACTLRGIQVYDALLSITDIENELAAAGSVRTPWYLNLNPTPDDIRDKSGNGHDPVWHSRNRPGLYTEE